MNPHHSAMTRRHTYVAASPKNLLTLPPAGKMQGASSCVSVIAYPYNHFIHYFSGLGRGWRVVRALLLSLCFALPAAAQVAVKTNLLYDATTTPNIALEAGVGKRSTVQLLYALNPWEFHTEGHGEKMAKHWVLMPEYRRWLCSRFNGHFLGVHAMAGQINASNVSIPLPGLFLKGDNIAGGVRHSRYEGAFAGIGLTYGYQWILGRHWNAEASAGMGYAHVWFDRYPCRECGARISTGQTNYLGITKLALSILYIF